MFKGFAAQMRNHKEIRYLITPANAVYSLGRVLVNDAKACLLYTSDAADDLLCVDLGGRRIIKKKKKQNKKHRSLPSNK